MKIEAIDTKAYRIPLSKPWGDQTHRVRSLELIVTDVIAARSMPNIGVGGSFDVLSGSVQRAPERWRKLGLEWLYRLVTEPHRWRRQLALPQFVLLVAGESVRSRFGKGKV